MKYKTDLVIDVEAAMPSHDGVQGAGEETTIAVTLVLRAAGQGVCDITEYLHKQIKIL